MASTEKTVTLWIYRAITFLSVVALLSDVVKADDVRRKTLTFHPSLQENSRETRDIVLPVNELGDGQDFSINQHISEHFKDDRVKRQATVLPSQGSSVRGFLPTLPANSTSVVSLFCKDLLILKLFLVPLTEIQNHAF